MIDSPKFCTARVLCYTVIILHTLAFLILHILVPLMIDGSYYPNVIVTCVYKCIKLLFRIKDPKQLLCPFLWLY